MNRDNYWLRRLNSSRLSRRRFVGGSAALGAGAAGLALVGCGDDDDDDDDDGGEPTATTGAGTPQPTSEPTQDPNAKQFGGTRRASSANNTYDTFDVDRSRFTPFAAIMGWTNLGFVHYRNFANAELEAAFAESYEQPDGSTIIFKLRPNLMWHDKPPVNGRAATVEDMKYFIDRNKAGVLLDGTEDPNFYRKSEYRNVESVEVTDAETLTVTFSQPNPFFLGTLASAYAKIQAPEAVEAFESSYQDLSADKIIGTGAFSLDEFDAEGTALFRRNEAFYDDVYLDGLQYFPLFTDNAALQAAFEQKEIDVYGPRTVEVKDELLSRFEGEIYETRTFSANPMAGTYYGGSPPWSDGNLIGAIFRTIDRRLLIEQLFQGSGALSKNIPPTQGSFGITEAELITLPGYLVDHQKDLTEAKAMWEAGGGPALGTITVDIPDIWEGAYSGVGASIVNMLTTTLGNEFVVEIHPYSTITNKLIDLTQAYGNGRNNIWYGWISDITQLEPTSGMYTVYHSAGAGFFQFGVKIDEVDSKLDQALAELDIEKRKELDQDIERLILAHWGAGIPHNMIQISNTLRWNYYQVGEDAPFVNAHNEYRDAWMNQNDPTWAGRPA
jgi:peptide/nickel transport system substrate-binding protein